MSAYQGSHQWQQTFQIGGQIHVHITHYIGIAIRPDMAQSAAPAFLVEVSGPYLGVGALQASSNLPGAVGAGVISNSDPPVEREMLAQIAAQARHASLQGNFFVVNRDNNFYHGRSF